MKLRNYEGVSVIRLGRAPTEYDYSKIPTLWIDESNKDSYMLVYVDPDSGRTQWDKFASVTYVDNTVATVSGNINSFLEMTDTPDNYSKGGLLYSTGSGIESMYPNITHSGSGALNINIDGFPNYSEDNEKVGVYVTTQDTTTQADYRSMCGNKNIFTFISDRPGTIDAAPWATSIDGIYTKVQTGRVECSDISNLYGYQIFTDCNSSGVVDSIKGIRSLTSSNGQGSVNELTGIEVEVMSDAVNWEASGWEYVNPTASVVSAYALKTKITTRYDTAAMNDAYSVYITSPSDFYGTGAGLINNYGLYIEDQSHGSVTVSDKTYSIYSEGGDNYFRDKITTSGSLDIVTSSGSSGDFASALHIKYTPDANVFGSSSPYVYGQYYSLYVPTLISGAATSYCGHYDLIRVSSANAAKICGYHNKVRNGDYGSNATTSIIGVETEASSNSDQDVPLVIGVTSLVSSDIWDWENGGPKSSAGTVTDIRSFSAGIECIGGHIVNGYTFYSSAADNFLSGTIDNLYGIYLEEQTEGSTNYTIYSAGGDNYFGGNITTSGVFNMPSNPPATSSGVGTTGDLAWDADYIYVCVADNTWKRSSLSSW